MGRDPEFFKYVRVPVAERILHRTKYALTQLDTHQNPYLDYILTGNFSQCLPYYLEKDNFERIRLNLDRLILHQGSIQDAAKKYGSEKFDGFNLSDIFEYLDEPACVEIYGTLLNYSRSGARLAYWNMLVPRQCPKKFENRVEYKTALSEDLFARDKAFFYSKFIVEEVL